MHAPKEDIAKYEGKYLSGWDTLRERRFEALKATGIVNSDAKIAPRHQDVPAWETLSSDQQLYQAKLMAVYAAMVDRIDQSIGRLIAHLEKTGELENTVIVFSSDNGPEAIDFTTDPIFAPTTDWIDANFDNSIDNLGSASSYPFYGRPWANAGTAGHRFYKTYVSQGGIHAPLILSWPGRVDSGGKTRAFATVLDIAPTIMEMAGVPQQNRDEESADFEPMAGRSMLPYLEGKTAAIYDEWDGQGFELFGNQAHIAGDWKIQRLRAPAGDGKWKLYNLARDPNETVDVSAENPKVMARLMESHERYLAENKVVLPPKDYQMFAN